MDDRDARIRDEAYRMWIDAGRPEGGDQHYWYEAEKRVAAEDGAGAKAAKNTAVKKPAKTASPATPSPVGAKSAPAVKAIAKNAGNSGVASPAVTPKKGERVEVAPVKTPIRAPRKSPSKPK